jgi:hypothetical protein
MRIVLSAGLLIVAAVASPAGATSLFSTNGLGETISPATGRGRPLGGVTVPIADAARVSLENPALLADLSRVSFTAVYVVERRSAENDVASESFSGGSLPIILGAVPFQRYVVLGTGLLREQETSINPLTVENIETPAPHSLRFERSGDIFRVPIAFGSRIRPWLSVGASFDVWFGSIEEEREIDFTNPGFRDTHDRQVDEMDGTGWSAGVLLEPTPRIAIGARYRGEETLTGSRLIGTIEGTTASSPIAHTMPTSYSGGALVQVATRLNVVFEVRHDLWEGVEGAASPPDGFEDATRWGGGIELIPLADPAASFFHRRAWRLGFHQAGWHVRDTGGASISEWFASAGTSFALGGEAGKADIFLEYGQRGDSNENELSETMIRIGFGLSGGEPWKKPARGRRGSVPTTTPTY